MKPTLNGPLQQGSGYSCLQLFDVQIFIVLILKNLKIKSRSTGLRLQLIATSLLGWTVNKKLLVMQHRHFSFLLMVKKERMMGKILVQIFRLGTGKLWFFWRTRASMRSMLHMFFVHLHKWNIRTSGERVNGHPVKTWSFSACSIQYVNNKSECQSL